DFIALPAPQSAALAPGAERSLTYTDTQGLPTTISVPAAALSTTVTLTVTPAVEQHEHLTVFAGHAFALDADPPLLAGAPLTVTVGYSDDDVRVVSDRAGLALRWWDGAAWQDAAQSCAVPQPASVDQDQ